MSQSDQTGATVSELAPEEKTKRLLSQWLEDNQATVYWEQENRFGYPVFRVNDDPNKPDLLLDNGSLKIAIETKRGDSKKSTYNALLQNHDYWLDYRTGRTEYKIDGRVIEIDAFLVANDHSLHGWLFGSDYERLLTYGQFGSGRQSAIDIGELPPSEGSMSEQFTRLQRRVAKKVSTDFETAVGSLLSTALDGEYNDPKPAALWTVGNQQGWVRL